MGNRYLGNTTLHVEGRDDLFAIANLLEAHRFKLDSSPRHIQINPATAETDEKGLGRTELLKLVETAVKAATGKAVGFVIDADRSAASTWDSIRERIARAASSGSSPFKLPRKCPRDGAIVDIPIVKARVGVWIMPNNSSDGMLEDFLCQLIKTNDKLYPIAVSSTDAARKAGAAFKATAKSKAIVHAWLAWQAHPGCPFGTAIKARYFNENAEYARKFVDWVRRLVD